jgi:hypothetical protein
VYGACGLHTLSLVPCDNLLAAMSSLLGLFPNTRREWIEFIIATVVLWLLMMVAISELELVAVPDQWRLNLANNFFALA